MIGSLLAQGAASGGNSLAMSASSSADGDNAFDNAFHYKTGAPQSGQIDSGDLLLAAVAITAIYVMGRK